MVKGNLRSVNDTTPMVQPLATGGRQKRALEKYGPAVAERERREATKEEAATTSEGHGEQPEQHVWLQAGTGAANPRCVLHGELQLEDREAAQDKKKAWIRERVDVLMSNRQRGVRTTTVEAGVEEGVSDAVEAVARLFDGVFGSGEGATTATNPDEPLTGEGAAVPMAVDSHGPVTRVRAAMAVANCRRGAEYSAEEVLRRANQELERHFRLDDEPLEPESATNEVERAAVHLADGHDGLPTTVMMIGGERRPVKLDTCARYSMAGRKWRQRGKRLKKRPPADEMEGIGGVALPVLGVWQFDMKNVYDQHVCVEACIVDGFDDDFFLGEDFMIRHGANIDFTTHEMTYTEGNDEVILPFRTFDSTSARAYKAVARTAKKWKANTQAIRNMDLTASAPNGEVGLFVPTLRATGDLLLGPTVTTAHDGVVTVPAMLVAGRRQRLPAKVALGTWVPLASEFEIMEDEGAFDRTAVEEWLKTLGDVDEPLPNEDACKLDLMTRTIAR